MPLIRIDTHPSTRQLRVFSLGCLVFAGGIGAHQWLKGNHSVAGLFWSFALIVPIAGLFWRAGLRRLYIGLCYATYPLGYLISTVVLVTLYYGVITPIGLILRLFRHDPLAGRPGSGNTSYWHPRKNNRSPESYFKQY